MGSRTHWVAIVAVFALVLAACSASAPIDATAAVSVPSTALLEDTAATEPGSEDDSAVSAERDDSPLVDRSTAADDGEATNQVAVVPSTEARVEDDLADGGAVDASASDASAAPGISSQSGGSESGDRSEAFASDVAAASNDVDSALSLLEDPIDETVRGAVVPASSCQAQPDTNLDEAPEWVVAALEAAVQHPDFEGLDVSVSVWIDGWGEVVTRDPDLALVPASNEKILVAHAANELIDAESTLDTTIERVGDDLVLRAAGDPTFSTWRANQLIEQVVAAGVTSADRLIIDVSAFPQPSAAPGWQSWQIRNFVGPLSGLMLDDNRWNTSEEFLETPALLNGEWFAGALRNAGIAVNSVEVGTAPTGTTVGEAQSAPVGTLIRDMMLFSDNQIADMTVLQLGLLEGDGTLEDGIAQIERELAELCVPLAGVMDDGSGLSRSNFRSAREFQQILRAIRESDTAEVFESQLPIGGVSGTLRNRFGGDAGRVQAKTGTIFGGRALSGYATTDSGRDAVFSILINGERERTSASLGALDALVRTILRS